MSGDRERDNKLRRVRQQRARVRFAKERAPPQTGFHPKTTRFGNQAAPPPDRVRDTSAEIERRHLFRTATAKSRRVPSLPRTPWDDEEKTDE